MVDGRQEMRLARRINTDDVSVRLPLFAVPWGLGSFTYWAARRPLLPIVKPTGRQEVPWWK